MLLVLLDGQVVDINHEDLSKAVHVLKEFLEKVLTKIFVKIFLRMKEIAYSMHEKLSQECRKEMQYYKMLAKAVENRIARLQPYICDDDTKDNNDSHDYDVCPRTPVRDNSSSTEDTCRSNRMEISSVKVKSDARSRNFVLDLSLHLDASSFENTPTECSSVSSTSLKLPIELPERDSDSKAFKPKELDVELVDILDNYDRSRRKTVKLVDLDSEKKTNAAVCKTGEKSNWKKEIVNVSFDIDKDNLSDVFLDLMPESEVSLCSSKSFTGSLLDLQSESAKESKCVPGLVRQRSYTVLEPSPQLLEHLKVQSQNTGVAVTSISMSDASPDPNHNQKKRRSWDLETAKKEWSSLALELKLNKPNVGTTNGSVRKAQCDVKNSSKKNNIVSPYRSNSVSQGRQVARLNKKNRTMSASDPIHIVPNTNAINNIPSDTTITQECILPSNRAAMKDGVPFKPNHTAMRDSPEHCKDLIPVIGSENPGSHLRNLLEKIQSQQFVQMASLKEKQKQEQLFLQRIFEEQNNILLKQLRTICPTPSEVRQAWGDEDQDQDVGSGPVSLSQLNHINKTLPCRTPNSPVSKTLTTSKNFIDQCDDVLKKSRDITSCIKKPLSEKRTPTISSNSNTKPTPVSPKIRASNRSISPPVRNTSRKLNYESASDYEVMLTDRTNDTLADLNVTFPSDSEDSRTLLKNGTIDSSKNVTVLRQSPEKPWSNGTDAAFTRIEKTKSQSLTNSTHAKQIVAFNIPPTPKNCAAATTIVAYAKGYLVRRLMRTERVQATVQTIRDALLCALQLHQDREGIRGADVDLHRRLIQQITAACYSVHDTFVSSSSAERCALIAADRARLRASAARRTPVPPHPPRVYRQTDIMSRSHSGAFPARSKRPSSAASLMTQSNYETFSGSPVTSNPRRRPWR